MRYNVAQLLKEPMGSIRRFRVDEAYTPGEDASPERAKGSLVLMRTDKGIWASASLEAEVIAVCSRCLAKFTVVTAVRIEEEYFPTIEVVSGRSLPLPELAEEDALTINSSHELDLEEAVRQYTIAQSPMKPLCSPQCRGLCPLCGGDRNRGDCDCEPAPVDPCWASLKRLLDR